MPDPETLLLIAAALAALAVVIAAAAWSAAAGARAATQALGEAFRVESEAQRRLLTMLDQGLRQEIAQGTRAGLSEAFDKVQAGQAAMQLVMGNFRSALSETIDRAGMASETALKNFSDRLAALELQLRAEQEQLRLVVGTKLDELRAGNEAKLEEMRRAVDEKLQSALEKQLKDSFTSLQEQLGAVQQAIGQVQSVAGEVGDLKRLFSNVKSRGGWGEAQLEAMLTDILPVGAFEKNFRVKENSAESVEFALRIPFRGGQNAWLAIDSKFPTEDYARLVAAHEAGQRDDEASARTALANRIRLEAKRIDSKYILAPRTLEFGVLYLPSDSLFAEVARVPGLIEEVRSKNNVMVMGPSLLPAFLHTLRVSYMTVALEEKASEIGQTLAAVKAEWVKFGQSLTRIRDQADTLSRGIKLTLVRQSVIGKKLRNVDAIDDVRSELLLGLDAPNSDEPDDDDEEA